MVTVCLVLRKNMRLKQNELNAKHVLFLTTPFVDGFVHIRIFRLF